GQALMQDHPPRHVVRAFVRQEVSQKLGTAPRDDAAPGFGVLCECVPLEGIDLVADDAGDLARQRFQDGTLPTGMFGWGFHECNLSRMVGSMFLWRQNLLSAFSAMIPLMSTPYAIADIAALVGEPTRAAILLALLGGRPLPAGALAVEANLSAAATSLHLSKLTRGGVLSVEQEGRPRYYRLANDEVAHALEALGVIAAAHRPPTRVLSPDRAAFRAARTCYDHLAGSLSVALAQRLERDDMVRATDPRAYEITEDGARWLAKE